MRATIQDVIDAIAAGDVDELTDIHIAEALDLYATRNCFRYAPWYTTSMDAAMCLVPWELPVIITRVGENNCVQVGEHVTVEHRGPLVHAVVIAALRARL